jgi:hypothetical protein
MCKPCFELILTYAGEPIKELNIIHVTEIMSVRNVIGKDRGNSLRNEK